MGLYVFIGASIGFFISWTIGIHDFETALDMTVGALILYGSMRFWGIKV